MIKFDKSEFVFDGTPQELAFEAGIIASNIIEEGREIGGEAVAKWIFNIILTCMDSSRKITERFMEDNT